MGDFLTEVKTVTLRQKSQPDKPLLEETKPAKSTAKPLIQAERPTIDSPGHVLEILRSRPNTDALEDVLIYLSKRQNRDGFNIRVPSPSSAKITNELISTTIPDFWEDIDGLQDLLLDTLRSVAGIGAIIARLRLLVSQYKPTKQTLQSTDAARPILDLISVLSQVLKADDASYRIFKDIQRLVENQAKRDLLWKEYLASVASGRIVSAVAQAEDVFKLAESIKEKSWLSDGSKYSTFLGRNVAYMVQQTPNLSEKTALKAAAQLCGKGFNIGYAARLVEEIHLGLSLSERYPISFLQSLVDNLQGHEQRQFLVLTMKFLTKRRPELQDSTSDHVRGLLTTSPAIMATVSLLGFTTCNETIKAHLVSWLSDSAVNSNESFEIRRAAIAALASTTSARSTIDDDSIQTVLENTWKLFGDHLFIKHTSIIQQEACSQVLLMAVGYVHRTQPMFLFTLARSSLHLNGISNRLNASSPRARFLGMVVGMAVSQLVDKESKLTFDLDDMRTSEAEWYRHLTQVNNTVGAVEEMRKVLGVSHGVVSRKATSSQKARGTKSNAKTASTAQANFQGPRVVEVLDEDEDDDDLIPYAKPDSDPEDEDEDATMINRDKTKAPVYIRDLIAALHDTENYDRHTLALKTAASLIRRKSSFGKEVGDHAIELALILIGLGNTFDLDNFPELRLQALIAILISNPSHLAPWFSRQIFDGDYSISQRSVMLSVLGLGARELAGYKDEDEELNPKIQATSFPSKQLPDRLHKIYTPDTRTDLIASKLENTFIQPLAARAADDMSGPNILKVRTFSSRMEVEKKRKKPIANALAKIVAEAFFFPLTGRWWQNMQAYGSQNVHFQPFLLSMYIKTLAILLHASGPNTVSLPQMTSEFWELLLSVRTNALADVSVLEAVLFSLLTLLEVNEDKRRLAEDCGKQLMETQGWVELVFERSAGGDKEGERIRMLSASVLVKTRETVEKYQRLLVGSMLDY